MTQLPQAWLRAGRRGAWLAFAGVVMPVFAGEPRSLPILLFWAFPLVLPYWFAGFAALALSGLDDVQRSNRGWAALHSSITLIGAAMLPIWLHINTTLGRPNFNRVLLVVFLALLPAAMPLLSRRNPTWRLCRALWLNAAGCLLFAASFIAQSLRGSDGPSLFVLPPVIGLAVLLVVAIAIERHVPVHSAPSLAESDQPLPQARSLG